MSEGGRKRLRYVALAALSRRSLSHRPTVRCHALLTALLLPVVVADLSSRHSYMGDVQEAHGELQFV